MIGRVHGGRDKRDRDDADETPRQDAPASDGPATEAGRRLLEVTFWDRSPNSIRTAVEAGILAIEAEATAGPRVVKFDQNTTPEEAERIYRWMNPATEPHTEAGRELLTGLPWMGREHRLILAIEAEAAAGSRSEEHPHEPHSCKGHPPCDLGDDHDGECWFESGTEDD